MKEARRKLLKGSAAAPLLLTVQPAGAQALAMARGSIGLCVRRDQERSQQSPKPAELTGMQTDEWLRTQVDVCELYEQKDAKGLDRIDGNYFLGADRTYYWKIDDKVALSSQLASRSDYTVNKVVARKTGQVKQALVYLGPDGVPVGYAWEKNGGYPISRSCWHSFKPGTQR